MAHEDQDYYRKVLHGYMVHEHSQAGYHAAIIAIKLLMSSLALTMAAYATFAPQVGDTALAFCLSGSGCAFAVMVAIASIERKFGYLTLRFRSKASGMPSWEIRRV